MHVVIALGDRVEVTVGREGGLDYETARLVIEALTFDNPDYDVARRERNAWGVPKKVTYGTIMPHGQHGQFGKLITPRGFLHQLCDGLAQIDATWEIIDERVAPKFGNYLMIPKVVRDYQEAAVQAMLLDEQGIYKAPPGSGKTVTSLEIIRRAGLRALIVVDKTNIAQQWRDRCVEHFGYMPGIYGDGEEDIRDVTVAMAQTLHSRRDTLTDSWWRDWGTVVFDEMHHVPAETIANIVMRVRGKHLFGVSATPEWTDFRFQVAQALIGPVIHETSIDTLEEQGHLVRPRVVVHDSIFDFPFRGTRRNEETKRLERNNYNKMMDEIINDTMRNSVVAHMAKYEAENGHAVLVTTSRLEHIELLKQEILSASYGFPFSVYTMTGEHDTTHRKLVSEQIDRTSTGCVLLSTIADEALDIPRLDRLIMPFPTANTALVQQRVGRIARPHPNKNDAVVYDICDGLVSVLKKQFQKRAQYYHKMGYKVEFVDRPSV